MKDVYGLRKRRNAQTLVFFLLAWGTIMLLCGLAIDSGLLYLAKARMGRAVDGAALAAIGNFNRNTSSPQANRDAVALIMRNFAVANFTDLAPISGTIGSAGAPSGGTATTTTAATGVTTTTYFYSFNDGTQDANGAFRRFVDVTLTTKGTNGAIIAATCNARCPVQTYFIGYATYAIGGRQNVKIAGYSGPSGLADLKVSSSAVATRNPRLIMVVIDRSASMLAYDPADGIIGGATGLAPAVVQFLDFFDTSSDSIGIVSFGSSARLEMPLTTNFLIAGTNNLIDAYDTNVDAGTIINDPGLDPEAVSTNVLYEPGYNSGGVRRLKFGGQTAADDGIRLAMETMMANPGFSDPDVVKYMVLFTDGAWNATRTLVAAPGYVNELSCPLVTPTPSQYRANGACSGLSNGAPGAWVASTNLIEDTNIAPMPSMAINPLLGSLPTLTNAINASQPGASAYFMNIANNFTNYVWQSVDQSGYEPLPGAAVPVEGAFMGVTNTTWVGTSTNTTGPLTNYYTHNVDIWLQPGSVAFYHPLVGAPVPFVSDYTKPSKHINLYLNAGEKVDLYVPGYIVDGVLFDGIDLPFSFPTTSPNPTGSSEPAKYFRYRGNNYQEEFMWPDDTSPHLSAAQDGYAAYYSNSLERQLMFRNYPNLLTGFFPYRADEPNAPYNPSAPAGQQGIEPLITDATNSTLGYAGAPRPRYGNGAYYPSAGFYWPFGGGAGTNAAGYVTNAVGVDYYPTYGLPDPTSDPDGQFSNGYTGGSRHIAYSINMLSPDAAPEWYGELFYKGSGGTGVVSGNSSASTIMQSGDFKIGAPPFVSAMDVSGLMVDEATHNTTITGSPSVWRPVTFNGSNFLVGGLSGVTEGGSVTGGYVTDGQGNYYSNTMAYSGRPTHYYDFSQGKWVPVANNHESDQQLLPIGNWKAQEYAWHARALGVTIYTVGYGTLVDQAECQLLATIANSTNVVYPSGGGTATNDSAYNGNQPLGQQFYATTGAQISNDFYSVGQAINAALTQ